MPRLRTSATAVCSTVSVLRPRKSNFTRPAGSTHFMLNWVTGISGFRIAIERHQLGQRPLADDDAGGMGRGVAVQAFELLRDVEGALHHRIAVALGLQARLVVDRALERDRVGRILRHQLAQLVDLAVGHLQHAADVAQHAARLQGAEGDDLRHVVAAVAFLHVADHLVAPVLAEVDVEVRHRHALGIEEALEQTGRSGSDRGR